MANKQINIRLSDKAVEELKSLQKKMDLRSISDVIRSSVSLTKYLEAEKEQGNNIIIRSKDGSKEKEIVLLPK